MKISSDVEVELIEHWGDDQKVAKAARVSTGKDRLESQKIEGLINYLLKEGHETPLEHVGFTVRIEAPLFVLNQFVRHRHLSVNVHSHRYSEPIYKVYVPAKERPLANVGSSARPVFDALDEVRAEDARLLIELSTSRSFQDYTALKNLGVGNEIARSVLPANVYTAWYATGNLRAWFHFLHLRDGSHGYPQYEISLVAKQIHALIEKHYPVTYRAWVSRTE